MNKTAWDVIVVGSGPGGSVAAKICADAGLETLLVEKKLLPRDKVCSGMVMGYWAKDLMKENFGDIPKDVLIEQGQYNGITLHVGAEALVDIPAPIPVGWRKNLDYWMCKKAVEAGTQLKDGARVYNIRQLDRGYEVALKKENKETEIINTRFLIGADGAYSAVRKFVCPDLKVRYRPAYRECYEENLSIEKDRFHWFFPLIASSPRFDINYKEHFLLIEGGNIRQINVTMRRILGRYGFHPDVKPLWRDGCVIPVLHGDLLNGTFVPAKDNAMLVGDAAGMLFPFTHEGIGAALKSGVLAAQAVTEAIAENNTAGELYMRKIQGIKVFLKELWLLHQEMNDIAKNGADALAEAMGKFIEKTVQETGLVNGDRFMY
ncbi:MAG: NAD(P)/FAD-dependent oxidoreductase [Proteobacteria bacterium]|nr:NAD(P)/FAD-dependent oxidoreductase [Pseudomonadota bacterium]